MVCFIFLIVLLHGNPLMASWKPKQIGNINYAFLGKQQDKTCCKLNYYCYCSIK